MCVYLKAKTLLWKYINEMRGINKQSLPYVFQAQYQSWAKEITRILYSLLWKLPICQQNSNPLQQNFFGNNIKLMILRQLDKTQSETGERLLLKKLRFVTISLNNFYRLIEIEIIMIVNGLQNLRTNNCIDWFVFKIGYWNRFQLRLDNSD